MLTSITTTIMKNPSRCSMFSYSSDTDYSINLR